MDRVSVFIVGLCLAGMVSGEDEIIPAVIGEDVTLPCEAKERFPFKLVEWNRPNGGNTEFILVFKEKKISKSDTPDRYMGRVEFKDLQKGNASLVLKNVTAEDEGRYECYVEKASNRSKRSIEPISTIYLDVPPPLPDVRPPPGNIGLIVALAFFALVVAVFAAFVVKKKQRSSPPPPDKEAEKPLQIQPTAADPSIP
ncbi:sodium channel subunit beta-2-like [Cyprinodon tularosa]|uniref:sodium channel subunit beta-2-like n=1 Tax=Cyprinodon tularosa TaxID=77115 RepID=UPI0018E28BB2|nr:sodium channel subunit beta-2-like [Cyprinodon tularosa]